MFGSKNPADQGLEGRVVIEAEYTRAALPAPGERSRHAAVEVFLPARERLCSRRRPKRVFPPKRGTK
jgi:hypothetical protein